MKNRKTLHDKYLTLEARVDNLPVTSTTAHSFLAQMDALSYLMGDDEGGITNEVIPTPKTDTDLDRVISALKADRPTAPSRMTVGVKRTRGNIDAQIAICEWAKGE